MNLFRKYGLELHPSGFDSDYDMNIEGGALNELAVTLPFLAFSLLPDHPFSHSFNDPSILYTVEGIESIIK